MKWFIAAVLIGLAIQVGIYGGGPSYWSDENAPRIVREFGPAFLVAAIVFFALGVWVLI